MVKINFFILLFISLNFYAQTYTTGVLMLTTGRTVKFDVNTATNVVTMTMVKPENSWLGVGPGITTGLTMGSAGDDVITYSSVGLEDRNMKGTNKEPNIDISQDWTVVSSNLNNGERTIVATRARDTGDSNDYKFALTPEPFSVLYAYGNTDVFGKHAKESNGAVIASPTLSVDTFFVNRFKLYPNPVTSILNIELVDVMQNGIATIYDVLGNQVLYCNISHRNSNINLSNLVSGGYIIKFVSGNYVETKYFVKQ